MISLINYDSSEGEQWGRYNLPRTMGLIIHDILSGAKMERHVFLHGQSPT